MPGNNSGHVAVARYARMKMLITQILRGIMIRNKR